jgi:hypothetical protein
MGTSACFRISTWSRDCAKGRLDSRFRDTGKDSADFRLAVPGCNRQIRLYPQRKWTSIRFKAQ